MLQVRDYYLILRRDVGLLNDVETDIENGCGDFQILFKLSIFFKYGMIMSQWGAGNGVE